jgi:hypothetical protein
MPGHGNAGQQVDDFARLVHELDEAEAYGQRLRRFIVEARDQLASGHPSMAQSILNEALNYIDSATDVVASGKANP